MNFLSTAIGGIGGFLLGGPAGALAGAGLGAQIGGAESANAANQGISRETMDFQKSMSNTAHQRETQDLRAAGLNPVLAVNAGSSTPAGAPIAMQNTMQGMGSSAVELANVGLDLNLKKADLENRQMQKQQLAAQTANTLMDTTVKSRMLPEAEMRNDIWDVVRPWSRKLKEALTPNAKPTIPKGGMR